VRRDGHAYFTNPVFGCSASRRELDFHGVYHLAPDGRREARPNGITLSLDGRVLYLADSDARLMRACDFDEATASDRQDMLNFSHAHPCHPVRKDLTERSDTGRVAGVRSFAEARRLLRATQEDRDARL